MDRRTMRCRIIRRWLAFALLAGVSEPVDAQPVRRFPADTFWRRLWTAGSKDDGLFVEPRAVVVHQDRVTVLDRGTREVLSFDRRTGRSLLRLTARGSGPGEFKRPAHLVTTGDGFAVVDHANMRLSSFDAQGRMRWDIIIPEIFRVSDLCFLSPTRVLVHYKRRDSSMVVFDSAGRRLSVRSIPWTAARPSTMTFLHEAFMSPVTADGSCALVSYFGAEWAMIPGDAAGRRMAIHRYIEPGAEPVVIRNETPMSPTDPMPKVVPEVTETPPIAKGVLLRRDTVIVMGARTRSDPHRLLDYYERATGRYLYSRRLPFPLVALAIDDDGTFFGAVIEENIQALVAFRPERLTKAVQRELDRARKTSVPLRDTVARRSPPAPARPRGSR